MHLRPRGSCLPLGPVLLFHPRSRVPPASSPAAAGQPPTWADTGLPTHAEHVQPGRVQASPALDRACSSLPPTGGAQLAWRPSAPPLPCWSQGALLAAASASGESQSLRSGPSGWPNARWSFQAFRGPREGSVFSVASGCRAQQFSLRWPIDSVQWQWKPKHTHKIVVLVYTSNE